MSGSTNKSFHLRNAGNSPAILFRTQGLFEYYTDIAKTDFNQTANDWTSSKKQSPRNRIAKDRIDDSYQGARKEAFELGFLTPPRYMGKLIEKHRVKTTLLPRRSATTRAEKFWYKLKF